MQRFLLKTEPTVYSYDDLVRDRKTVWDGVSNFAALKHIRSMKKGDIAFVYHTGNEKQVVGIAKIVSDPFPDPKAKDKKLVVFELQPSERLKNPVTLASVKARKEFKNFSLVRIPRLSVMPVSADEWEMIVAMSK